MTGPVPAPPPGSPGPPRPGPGPAPAAPPGPAGPTRPAPGPPPARTGAAEPGAAPEAVAAAVGAAAAALDGLAQRPLAEHVAVFEHLHAVLGEALAGGATGPGRA